MFGDRLGYCKLLQRDGDSETRRAGREGGRAGALCDDRGCAAGRAVVGWS